LSSEGAFIQAYNAQAVVDADSMIVLSAEMANQAVDSPHLVGLMEQVEETVERRPSEMSADSHYSEKHLKWLEQAEMRHSYRRTKSDTASAERNLILAGGFPRMLTGIA